MMKNIFTILFLFTLIFCNSQQITDSIFKSNIPTSKTNQEYFRNNEVYSQLIENNFYELYYFNSENNAVYSTKIERQINDSLKIIEAKLFGKYEIKNNIIKIKESVYKKSSYRGKYTSSILFMFIPMRLSGAKEVTILDKEIIIEGIIDKDSIKLNKTYLGKKYSDFEKKFSSKTENINLTLKYEPNLKATAIKSKLYDTYTVTINFKNNSN